MSFNICSGLDPAGPLFRKQWKPNCFLQGKSIGGFNMDHYFPNEFKKPNAAFGQIVKDQYACRDACIAKAPKCGGFTYFTEAVRGQGNKGACLLKANPEHEQVNMKGPYNYVSIPSTISGSLSCLGIEKGKGSL